MTPETLSKAVLEALDDMKAVDVRMLDVRNLTSVTDYMIIASGRSDRQVRALADKVVETAKALKSGPVGMEGKESGEWILVDLGDVIAHLMHPTTRAYYQLEKLWMVDDQQATRRR